MAESATTTRPARTRAASTRAAKAAPAKPAAAEPAKTEVTRFKVELEPAGVTKSYAKFVMPDSYKGTAVGTIYAPLGTARVAVLVIGADDTDE